MNFAMSRTVLFNKIGIVLSIFVTVGVVAEQASSQTTAYRQAVAEAAAPDDTVAGWYRTSGYDSLWTSADDAERRSALLTALDAAVDHGLAVVRYDAGALRIAFRAARTEGDRGRLEVRMTRAFLDYADDIRSGVLVPSKIDPGIVREVPVLDENAALAAISAGNPVDFLRSLPPKAPAYAL